MLLTERQTDRKKNRQTNKQCYRKHNLLCQGGNLRGETVGINGVSDPKSASGS